MACRVAFWACLVVSLAATTRAQQSNKEVPVPPNGCSTFVVDSGTDEYSYNVTLGVASLNNCSNVTITKYFPDGSCLNGDGSGNELDFSKLSCAKADGNSSQTCTNAFNQAKAERKVALTSMQPGAQIDAGNSCDKASNGYIFVQNSCASNVTVGIVFQHGSYNAALPCIKVAGHSISGIGIAIIVIAIVLVLVCLMAIIACCCCRS